jgi:AcrR family transcriptional regulator
MTMPETVELPALNSSPPTSSHDRILYAGKRLFARNGYENTSTVAIAREAGTSESQLMKHFGSKQGLLSAVLDHGWMKILRRVQATQGNESLQQRLLAALEAMVIELENDSELKELVALEAHRVRKDGRDVLVSSGYRQFSELIASLLSEMRERKLIRPDVNLDAIRAGLIGMADGLVREQVVAGRSDARANYSFDDVRKMLEVMLPAFGADTVQRLRVVSG